VKKHGLTILLLVGLILSACQAAPPPKPTPIPPAEPTLAPAEPTSTSEPLPIKLTLWTERGKECPRSVTNYVTGDTQDWGEDKAQPGDLILWWVEQFKKAYPQWANIEIEYILGSYEGGLTSGEFGALIAAGEMPDIVDMFAGRLGGLAEEIGIDMSGYLTDDQIADFVDYEASLNEDGELRMIPWHGLLDRKGINISLAERACAQEGFDCNIPQEPWEIVQYADLLVMADAVKALNEDNWLFCWWGQNASGQHHHWWWFSNAGLAMFEDGEYQGFNTEEGLYVLEEILRLYNEGYFIPDAPGLNDDVCYVYQNLGQELLSAGLDNASDYDIGGGAVLSGELEEPYKGLPIFGIQFFDDVPPMALGTPISDAITVTEHTPDHARQAAVDFAWFMSSQFYNEDTWHPAVFRSQQDRGYMTANVDPWFELAEEYGMADQGMTVPCYNDIRLLFSELITSMFLGLSTPQEVLDGLDAGAAEFCK